MLTLQREYSCSHSNICSEVTSDKQRECLLKISKQIFGKSKLLLENSQHIFGKSELWFANLQQIFGKSVLLFKKSCGLKQQVSQICGKNQQNIISNEFSLKSHEKSGILSKITCIGFAQYCSTPYPTKALGLSLGKQNGQKRTALYQKPCGAVLNFPNV